MPDNETQADTVSREAHERVKRELADAKEQLGKATSALASYSKRDHARAYFKGKVSDPDAIADLVTPHLEDVDSDKIPEFLAQDRFKPLLAMGVTTPPATDGEGTGEDIAGQEPAVEQPGSFGGPSPGGTDGTKPMGEGGQKILVGSKEWQAAVNANDSEQIEKWEKAGALVEPARPW